MEPTLFALIVCAAGLFTSRTGALYCQIALCLFGATAAITLTALGGAVITPAVLFLPFLLIRAWSEQYGRRPAYQLPAAGAWLGLAVFWGVLGACFLPRFFAGVIEVVSLDRISSGPALAPLRAVSGNITQSSYAIGGFLAFLAMRALLEKPGRLEHFRNAVLLLATLNCLAAALNLAEFHLGFPPVLQYVRTAYALFDAYETAGLMRIHGTFSETSGFCGFSMPLFAFTFSLWLHNVRPLFSGALAFTLLALLLLSTSATAYGGLVLYMSLLMFVLTYRGYVRGAVPRIGLLVAGALLACVVVGSNFVFETAIAQRVELYFQQVLFTKLDSSSGIQRSLWNRQAWSNFVDTYGIGVGLGSTRASSYLLVLLSNLGLIGTLFYLAFVKRVITTQGSPLQAPIPEAARQATLAALSTALMSATVFDLGVTFYSFAAAGSLASVTHAARDYSPAGGLAGSVSLRSQP